MSIYPDKDKSVITCIAPITKTNWPEWAKWKGPGPQPDEWIATNPVSQSLVTIKPYQMEE